MSERCPTCGSENRSDCTLRLIGFPTSMCCIHPWHSGEASASAPTTTSAWHYSGEVSAPAPTPTIEPPFYNSETGYVEDATLGTGVAASEVQTAPKDTEWIKKTAEELDGVYMDHVGERALSVTLVEQIIERNYRMSLTASGVQTADERAEFEKWYVSEGNRPGDLETWDAEASQYGRNQTDFAWAAWQAARALSGPKA